MILRKKFIIALCLFLSGGICGSEACAQAAPDTVTVENVETLVPVEPNRVTDPYDPFTEHGYLGHFTWGAQLSSGVDMTTHDMTNFSIGAEFGYKNRWFRFVGVGASIMSMMNNSSRCYPVYAMVRTSFSKYHKLCFLELRGGVSFNSILDSSHATGAYGSAGIGITLAHGRTFSSHVVLRAEVMPIKASYSDPSLDFSYTLALACIGIGIAF